MDLISLVPVLGFALFLQRHARLVPAAAVLHAVSGVVLVLYLGGLAGLLWPTALALHIVGLALLGHLAWLTIRRGRLPDLPVPYVLFFGFAVLTWLLKHTSEYRFYDDYAHWGVYIRDMAARDAYWLGTTNAMHPRYVPGSSLWHYFMTAFMPPSEGRALVGHFVLLVTPLLILWNGLRWRQAGWILGIFALCVLLVTNFGHASSSLYVDHVLGAWFIGTLLCYMADTNRSFRHLAWYILPLSLIALLKDAGLAFAFSAAAIMAALAFERSRPQPGSLWKHAGQAALVFVLLCVPVLACVQLWAWNRDAAGAVEDVQSVGGVASGLAHLLHSDLGGRAAVTGARFWEVFQHQQISNDSTSWKLNAFSWQARDLFTGRFRLTTLWLFVIGVLWWPLATRVVVDEQHRRSWHILGAGLLLAAVAYVGLLFMSYLFAFGERGPELSSYVRYVQAIALPVVAACFASLLPGLQPMESSGSRRSQIAAGIFAVALAALYLREPPYWRPLLLPNPPNTFRRDVAPAVSAVRAAVGDAAVWIQLSEDEPNGIRGRILGLLFAPTPVFVEHDPAALSMPLTVARAAQLGYAWISAPALAPLQIGDSSSTLQGLFRVRDAGEGAFMFEPVPVGIP